MDPGLPEPGENDQFQLIQNGHRFHKLPGADLRIGGALGGISTSLGFSSGHQLCTIQHRFYWLTLTGRVAQNKPEYSLGFYLCLCSKSSLFRTQAAFVPQPLSCPGTNRLLATPLGLGGSIYRMKWLSESGILIIITNTHFNAIITFNHLVGLDNLTSLDNQCSTTVPEREFFSFSNHSKFKSQ